MTTHTYTRVAYPTFADQLTLLRELFPELASASFNQECAETSLSSDAEACFLIPYHKVWKTYQCMWDAVKDVLIEKFPTFQDVHHGALTKAFCNRRTRAALDCLYHRQQGAQILVVPTRLTCTVKEKGWTSDTFQAWTHRDGNDNFCLDVASVGTIILHLHSSGLGSGMFECIGSRRVDTYAKAPLFYVNHKAEGGGHCDLRGIQPRDLGGIYMPTGIV